MDESSVVGLEGGYTQKWAEMSSEEKEQVAEQYGEDDLIKTEGKRLPRRRALRTDKCVLCRVSGVCFQLPLCSHRPQLWLLPGEGEGRSLSTSYKPVTQLFTRTEVASAIQNNYRIKTSKC